MGTITGLFDSERDAGIALDQLYQLGFSDEDVEIVTSTDRTTGIDRQTDDSGQMVGDVGALPVFGKERAAGLITAYNTGGVGALKDALEDMGIGFDEAGYYARAVDGGAALLVLQVDDDELDDVREILEEAGGRVAGS